MRLAFEHWNSKLNGNAAKVYTILLLHADASKEALECWPSQPTIAREACLDERSTRLAIKELKAVGAISVEQRGPKAAKYRVCIPAAANEARRVAKKVKPEQQTAPVVAAARSRAPRAAPAATIHPAAHLLLARIQEHQTRRAAFVAAWDASEYMTPADDEETRRNMMAAPNDPLPELCELGILDEYLRTRVSMRGVLFGKAKRAAAAAAKAAKS